MSDSQRYPWNRYLINNAEDIVVFLGLKVFHSKNSSMFSCSKKAQVTFVEKSQLKIISLQNHKHSYLIHTWSDKTFNPTLSSLNEGSLEITLTVPLYVTEGWKYTLSHYPILICIRPDHYPSYPYLDPAGSLSPLSLFVSGRIKVYLYPWSWGRNLKEISFSV